MGRAIVREPQAFLMDEPLSNLDAKLRVGMRASLAQLHARLGVTTVYVTHDQIEAMTLGQRVAVMRDGRILQVDEPQKLYNEPRDLFVAAFIGSPAMNLVEATIEGDEVVVRPVPRAARPDRRPARGDGRVVLGIRPGELRGRRVRAARELPRIEVAGRGARGARLRGARLLPRSTRRASRAETLEASEDEATLLADEESLFTARVDPRTACARRRHARASPSTRRGSTSSTRDGRATCVELAAGRPTVDPPGRGDPAVTAAERDEAERDARAACST